MERIINTIDKIINTLDYLIGKLENIGLFFVVGGLIGAIIQRTRQHMTFRKFVSVAVMGMFVGWVIGTASTELLGFSDKVAYATCALGGVFAEDLLKEVESFIKSLSDLVKNFINNKINK